MLEKGILLEDLNILLEWDRPVYELVQENNAKIIEQSDRIIIDWGKHTILSGLPLHLSNTYLLSKPTKFNFIESKFNGDEESFYYFNFIEKHLEKNYGCPFESEDDMEIKREKSRVWRISNVRIQLYLFEMHAFRLSFKIEKL